MAGMTPPAESSSNPCCSSARQATCCDPSEKVDCCDRKEGCGCEADEKSGARRQDPGAPPRGG